MTTHHILSGLNSVELLSLAPHGRCQEVQRGSRCKEGTMAIAVDNVWTGTREQEAAEEAIQLQSGRQGRISCPRT